MKNLLISIIAALILCGSTAAASAEPVENIQKGVTEVTIKDMESGYRYFTKKEPTPFKTLLKACPGDRAYDCLYKVDGKKEKLLYRYKATEMMMVLYTFESKIEIASR